MYVAVTRTKGSGDQTIEVARAAAESMLPWLREMDGFDGLMMLTDEAEGAIVVLAFWASREAAERHRVARQQFRERVTAMLNVEIEEVTGYDLTFAAVGPRMAELRR